MTSAGSLPKPSARQPMATPGLPTRLAPKRHAVSASAPTMEDVVKLRTHARRGGEGSSTCRGFNNSFATPADPVLRPCCLGHGERCEVRTREHCEFDRGFWDETATECSEVYCLETCGLKINVSAGVIRHSSSRATEAGGGCQPCLECGSATVTHTASLPHAGRNPQPVVSVDSAPVSPRRRRPWCPRHWPAVQAGGPDRAGVRLPSHDDHLACCWRWRCALGEPFRTCEGVVVLFPLFARPPPRR